MANIEKTAHEFAKPTNVWIKHAEKEKGIKKGRREAENAAGNEARGN